MKPAFNKRQLTQLALILEALETHENRLAEKIAKALCGMSCPAAPAPVSAVRSQARPNEKFCPNYASLSAATGMSLWTLKCLRAASQGTADNPFCGKGAYPSDIHQWRLNHRDWQPSHVWPRDQSSAAGVDSQRPAPRRTRARPQPSGDQIPETANNWEAPQPEPGERFCKNYAELSAALAISRQDLHMLHMLADSEPETSPFIANGGYPSRFTHWVKEYAESHPRIAEIHNQLSQP